MERKEKDWNKIKQTFNKQGDSLPSHQLDDISYKSSKENILMHIIIISVKSVAFFKDNVSENKQLVGVALLPLVSIFFLVDRFLWKAKSQLIDKTPAYYLFRCLVTLYLH